MRYVLIGLGVVTIALAVWLAREGQWWIAVPDALFGAGVAIVARESMHEDAAPQPVLAPPIITVAPPPPIPAAPAVAPPSAMPRPKSHHPQRRNQRRGR